MGPSPTWLLQREMTFLPGLKTDYIQGQLETVFIDKVLLEHGHEHLLTSCGRAFLVVEQ